MIFPSFKKSVIKFIPIFLLCEIRYSKIQLILQRDIKYSYLLFVYVTGVCILSLCWWTAYTEFDDTGNMKSVEYICNNT
jgi:hypothetical protein